MAKTVTKRESVYGYDVHSALRIGLSRIDRNPSRVLLDEKDREGSVSALSSKASVQIYWFDVA